jgi:hypothetical protein
MEKEKELSQKTEADQKETGLSQENSGLTNQHDNDEGLHHGDEEEEHEAEDFSQYTKSQLASMAQDLLESEDFVKADRKLRDIKHAFDELREADKNNALQKFIGQGGDEEGFDYKPDAAEQKFDAAYKQIKEKKAGQVREFEKQREKNLVIKNELLEKLRNLVDAEETNVSINKLKEIQKQWQSTGPVAPQHARNLWANYSALLDRFYDNRSIYFELKELDRKKNLEAKSEICERAEKLIEESNLNHAIKTLNELHEEFRHIGPVPREEQEALWQRFKAASDKIYSRRKDFVDELKQKQQANLSVKKAIVEKVKPFSSFHSESIKEWNQKTKEIQEVQKEWEAAGSVSRDAGKEVNKAFWTSFKSFFNNKNAFFKQLEGVREENLQKKEELVKKAQDLKESTDWNATAQKIKHLQNEWKNIGPVPEKKREEVYQRFKEACDYFFNQKRSQSSQVDKEYQENLKQKQAICEQIEQLAEKKSTDVDKLTQLQEEWATIGFVPRSQIKSIQNRYAQAIDKFLDASKDLNSEEKQTIKLAIEINKIKAEPNANQKIYRKEMAIRKQIHVIENDVSLWKNNLEFFSNSKTADKLKVEFDKKIEKANQEIEQLKEQLRIIQSMEE